MSGLSNGIISNLGGCWPDVRHWGTGHCGTRSLQNFSIPQTGWLKSPPLKCQPNVGHHCVDGLVDSSPRDIHIGSLSSLLTPRSNLTHVCIILSSPICSRPPSACRWGTLIDCVVFSQLQLQSKQCGHNCKIDTRLGD